MFSSTLLLLAFLFLSVDGRSTSPWNRRLPTLASSTPTTTTASSKYLMLPQIRGGDSSGTPSSNFSTASSALSTPASTRIGEEKEDETVPPEASSYKIHPSITGGHILRAGSKVDPNTDKPAKATKKASNSSNPNVVVESFVTKEDKATKKILKRHKQIAKKLKVRMVVSHCITLHCLSSHAFAWF